VLGNRIKRLILLRLLFAALLLYAPSAFDESLALPFYTISSLLCLLSAFYVVWYVTRRWLRLLALLQMGFDVLIETALVFMTGGMESLFATSYVLTILSTALVLGERKSVLQITAFSSGAYLIASWMVHPAGSRILLPADPVYFLYGTSVRIVIFFTVGYLSRQLSRSVLELEAQLKLSERLSLLGEAASKIAHEVRNPLSSIRTASEVLRDTLAGKLDDSQGRMVDLIYNESDRLNQTLQRILNYARQTGPHPKLLLLDKLVDRTVSLAELNSNGQSKNVSVEKKYEPSRTYVYADEEQLLAALLNLTLNAYQAMPEGGVLTVEAEERLNGTEISLGDTGGGIPSEKIKDLFQPFKSNRKGGTGLGLAEVQKIVTLHEGKIEVESHLGKGTEFHLFFPKP